MKLILNSTLNIFDFKMILGVGVVDDIVENRVFELCLIENICRHWMKNSKFKVVVDVDDIRGKVLDLQMEVFNNNNRFISLKRNFYEW